MEGQNEYGIEGPGPQGGDDHPRRAGQIAGGALAGLLDRVVYLEAIVGTRETTIADLDEEVEQLKGLHSEAVERWKTEGDRWRRIHRRTEKVMDGLEAAGRNAATTLQSVFDRAQGRPVGKSAQPVKAIEGNVSRLRFEIAQADRLRRGYDLQYDGFEDNVISGGGATAGGYARVL